MDSAAVALAIVVSAASEQVDLAVGYCCGIGDSYAGEGVVGKEQSFLVDHLVEAVGVAETVGVVEAVAVVVLVEGEKWIGYQLVAPWMAGCILWEQYEWGSSQIPSFLVLAFLVYILSFLEPR